MLVLFLKGKLLEQIWNHKRKGKVKPKARVHCLPPGWIGHRKPKLFTCHKAYSQKVAQVQDAGSRSEPTSTKLEDPRKAEAAQSPLREVPQVQPSRNSRRLRSENCLAALGSGNDTASQVPSPFLEFSSWTHFLSGLAKKEVLLP